MKNIARQRCYNHVNREAVARCPECRRFFCRECVSEHDGRMICARCLTKLSHTPVRRHSFFRKLLRPVQIIAGIMILWFAFYSLGHMLLTVPSAFHEGTLWEALQE